MTHGKKNFFLLSHRGCFKNAQRAGQEQLYGAEFPWSEPHPQHPGPPGSGRGSRAQRRAYGVRAGALGGQSAGQSVVSCGRVFNRPQWLSSHADLQGNGVELSQPGPKVPAGPTQNQRTNQVAAFTALKTRLLSFLKSFCFYYLFSSVARVNMSRTDLSQTQDTGHESVRCEVFEYYFKNVRPLAISNSECSSDVSVVRLPIFYLFQLL